MLALVGVGITAAVYGSVALIVKADDVGVRLAESSAASPLGTLTRAIGRGLVLGMPVLLKLLGVVGTAAMIWVGGGIIVHGLEEYGLPFIGNTIHHGADIAGNAFPALSGVAEWIIAAIGSGIVGVLVGAVLIPLTEHVLSPAWKALTRSGETEARSPQR